LSAAIHIVIAFLTIAAGACSKPPATTEPVNAETRHDATLAPDQFQFVKELPAVISDDYPELKVSFPVINHTKSSVHFETVRPSCSCSSADLRHRDLEPGESTALEITANLRGRSGKQQFTVNLLEDSGRAWNYLLATTIYPRASFSVPNGVLQLGHAAPNHVGQTSLSLRAYPDNP
jgi:hypothetical protein